MVDKQKIKEVLEEQLQLLSEHSKKCKEDRDLAAMTYEMVNLVSILLTFY